VTRILYYRS